MIIWPNPIHKKIPQNSTQPIPIQCLMNLILVQLVNNITRPPSEEHAESGVPAVLEFMGWNMMPFGVRVTDLSEYKSSAPNINHHRSSRLTALARDESVRVMYAECCEVIRRERESYSRSRDRWRSVGYITPTWYQTSTVELTVSFIHAWRQPTATRHVRASRHSHRQTDRTTTNISGVAWRRGSFPCSGNAWERRPQSYLTVPNSPLVIRTLVVNTPRLRPDSQFAKFFVPRSNSAPRPPTLNC